MFALLMLISAPFVEKLDALPPGLKKVFTAPGVIADAIRFDDRAPDCATVDDSTPDEAFKKAPAILFKEAKKRLVTAVDIAAK